MPGKQTFKLLVVGLLDEIKKCKLIAVVRIKNSRSCWRSSEHGMIKLVGHPSHWDVKQQSIPGLGMVQQVTSCGSPVVALNVHVLFVRADRPPEGKNQNQQKSGRHQHRAKAGNSASDEEP